MPRAVPRKRVVNSLTQRAEVDRSPRSTLNAYGQPTLADPVTVLTDVPCRTFETTVTEVDDAQQAYVATLRVMRAPLGVDLRSGDIVTIDSERATVSTVMQRSDHQKIILEEYGS